MLVLCGKEMTELEFQEVEKYRYHFCKIGVIGRKMLYLGPKIAKIKRVHFGLMRGSLLNSIQGGCLQRL